GEEELRLASGGAEELNEKLQRMIRKFSENVDQEDPEYVTLREAFHERFRKHGFAPQNMDEINSYSQAMDEILQKLAELQRRNAALLRKYNGDVKFARVHKRIKEENETRKRAGKPVILSEFDESIVSALMVIKSDIDGKVYDRNDILRQDAYFERTVMAEISAGMDSLGVVNTREDRVFIQSRITRQYLAQYNETYPAA
ncbi:MAG: type I restriction endonuclease subunit R, partial [Clostridia bacterium]|nr:type I restriction endonuclease subunit R [Clostridia bacterium]